MTIPNEVLKKWERLRDQGDVTELMKLAKRSQPIILKALNEGECTAEVFKVIADFYNKRDEMVKNAA